MNRRKILSFVLAICMVFSLAPVSAFAETSSGEVVVTSYADFTKQISAEGTADTIILGGDISSDYNDGDDAMIIERAVTIKSGEKRHTLTISEGGIILGANVSFENINISFSNAVRNAIIANGYDLTLNNVSSTGTFPVNIFCGGITDYNGENTTVPSSDVSEGSTTLTIKGSNSLRDIYAGSLSDGPTEAEAQTNSFDRDVEIVVESGATGTIGDVYACGAREPRDGSDPHGFAGNPSMYITNGHVTVKLDGSLIKNVYGETGGTGATFVEYEDANGYPNQSTVLESIAALSVKNNGNLKPALGSSFSGKPDLSVAEGATLDLGNFGSSIPVNDFTGGGTLILAASQVMGISGAVSGTTTVAIGGITEQEFSTVSPETGDIYITITDTSNVNGKEFDFLWDKLITGNRPIYNADEKAWITTYEEYEPVVESFDITPQEISSEYSDFNAEDGGGVSYSISIDLPEGEDTRRLNYIPFVYKVKDLSDNNEYEAAYEKDIYGYYGYVEELTLCMGVVKGASKNSWTFDVYHDPYYPESCVEIGNYEVTVAYETSSGIVEKTVTLKVIPDDMRVPVAAPTAVTNLTYTGSAQTGVAEGEGYTLTGNTAENAGNYQATATLKDGYKWSDGTSEPKKISWSISKAKLDESGSKTKVTLQSASYTYNGSSKKPGVTVKYGTRTLKNGTDYTVTYKNNVYPGTAKVTVTGKGNYSGSIYKSFTIKAPDLAATKSVTANLNGGYDDLRAAWSKVPGATGYYVYYKKSTAKSYTYLGTTTGVSYKKTNLADGAAYSFRIYPYVKINGKVYKDSSYKTSGSVYTLKKLSTPKVSKKSRRYVKVSWTNIPGETGYQIARSTRKSKGYKVVKTESYKKKTASIKTTRKKTYYYKIRAYKTVSGKKIYGPWSSPRKYKLK